MRIQKYLSQQNILSRRKAEEYLKKRLDFNQWEGCYRAWYDH